MKSRQVQNWLSDLEADWLIDLVNCLERVIGRDSIHGLPVLTSEIRSLGKVHPFCMAWNRLV